MEYEGSGLDLVIKITYPTHLNSNAKTQMQVGRLWKDFPMMNLLYTAFFLSNSNMRSR
jgi:hypothetical protein